MLFFSTVLFHISSFNLVRLFPSKYHYKIVKKKLFISIKHDLIIGRDMPETCRQKNLIKTWISQKLLLFFHILDLRNDLTPNYSKTS